jgi:hypothetical protein
MTRDEIAQMMQDSSGLHWGDEAHFQRFAALVTAAEREACALVCEQFDAENPYIGQAKACAFEIRERRNG